jgi:hypothetical protein
MKRARQIIHLQPTPKGVDPAGFSRVRPSRAATIFTGSGSVGFIPHGGTIHSFALRANRTRSQHPQTDLILAPMGRCPALRDEIDRPFGPFVVVFLKWQHLATIFGSSWSPRIFLQSIETDLDSGAGLHRYGKHPSGSSCQVSTTSSSMKAIDKRVARLRQVWSSRHGEFSWGHASQWAEKKEELAAAFERWSSAACREGRVKYPGDKTR